MQRAGVGAGNVRADPISVVIGMRPRRRAEIAAAVFRGDDLGGGAFQEHDVVGAGRLVNCPGHVLDTRQIDCDRERPAVIVETIVGDKGVLDAREVVVVGGRTCPRIGVGKRVIRIQAVRRIAEIVDEGVVPVAHELADDADPRAPQIEPAGKTRLIESFRPGPIVQIAARVDVQAAGQFDRVLIIGAGEPEMKAVGARHNDMRAFSDRHPSTLRHQYGSLPAECPDFRSQRTDLGLMSSFDLLDLRFELLNLRIVCAG